MGRFRPSLRGIACLTLVALAIQFALAFGHVAHGQTLRLENDRKPVLARAPAHDSDGLVDASLRASARTAARPHRQHPALSR
jgi:hypothetical protein